MYSQKYLEWYWTEVIRWGSIRNRFIREGRFQRRIVVGTRFDAKINLFFCYKTFFSKINIEKKRIYTEILGKLQKKKNKPPSLYKYREGFNYAHIVNTELVTGN